MLTKKQLDCNGYMISELGPTRISLYSEHGVYHLKSNNVLGSGQVWQVYDSSNGSYKKAISQFRKLRVIQKGSYTLNHYEVIDA